MIVMDMRHEYRPDLERVVAVLAALGDRELPAMITMVDDGPQLSPTRPHGSGVAATGRNIAG